MIQNKQLVRLVASIVCGSIILGTPLFIYAEDEDLTNQLNTVQQQMNVQSSKATDAEAVIVSVFEQLRQIDAELQQATNELQAIQQQRIALDNDIALILESNPPAGPDETLNNSVPDFFQNNHLNNSLV